MRRENREIPPIFLVFYYNFPGIQFNRGGYPPPSTSTPGIGTQFNGWQDLEIDLTENLTGPGWYTTGQVPILHWGTGPVNYVYGGNVTPGLLDTGNSSISPVQLIGPLYYGFTYTCNLVYAFMTNFWPVANLTGPGGG
ncbi:hypothetical protein GCM10007108_02970 [Thermogymnomonas acidicola]|uniref:Uncharacterized protein n=1 Tax=Thermogymnomonas acidicola TaxID=399579 RepID=A0AA37F9D0_9ARCH|nr:hypothetical protein GCM10007108_02970 [Thermogymnomonas acidicola]